MGVLSTAASVAQVIATQQQKVQEQQEKKSLFGKIAGGIIGGVAGFCVGGPIGAVVGAGAGVAAAKGAEKVFSTEKGGKVGGGVAGGVVGAALGGPIGAGIGAMIGSKIGGSVGSNNETLNKFANGNGVMGAPSGMFNPAGTTGLFTPAQSGIGVGGKLINYNGGIWGDTATRFGTSKNDCLPDEASSFSLSSSNSINSSESRCGYGTHSNADSKLPSSLSYRKIKAL